MFIAVVYDISDNGRRNRLFKVLKNYITHVQKSVFEGFLSEVQFQAMKKEVLRVIHSKEDEVRYYILCNQCRRKIQTTPSSIVTTEPQTIIV